MMICGGLGLRRGSNKARKNYTRASRAGPISPLGWYLNKIEQGNQKSSRLEDCCIAFTEVEAKRIVHPHDDALVI